MRRSGGLRASQRRLQLHARVGGGDDKPHPGQVAGLVFPCHNVQLISLDAALERVAERWADDEGARARFAQGGHFSGGNVPSANDNAAGVFPGAAEARRR